MNATRMAAVDFAAPAAREPGLALSDASCRALGDLFAVCGSATFFDVLFDFMDRLVGIDGGVVLRYSRTQRPQMLMYRNPAPERKVPLDAYCSGAYLLCPFYHAFLNGMQPGFRRLSDIAPDDFESTEYYREFHGPTFVRDEVNCLLPERGEWAITLVLERYFRSACFSGADIETLRTAEPIVRESVLRHGALTEAIDPAPDDVFHARLRSAAKNFASSVLTPREREILLYMLRGYSAALTGARLGISEGTVKHHRKSIHRKLDIGSQAELFSLFLNCIAVATADGHGDPLELYQRLQRLTLESALVFGPGRDWRQL